MLQLVLIACPVPSMVVREGSRIHSSSWYLAPSSQTPRVRRQEIMPFLERLPHAVSAAAAPSMEAH